MAFIDALYLTR